MDEIYKIADWILRELAGTLSEEEQQLLEQWKASSVENKNLYEKIRNQKHFTDYQLRCSVHDYRKKYQEFLDMRRATQRHRWLKRLKYAAVIFFPLCISWGIFFYTGVKQEVEILQTESILPGKPMAILTLPDGKRVNLGGHEADLKIGNGIAVSHMDTLAYTNSGMAAKTEYHTVVIPRGGEYVLRLADGTSVWLNAETEVRYPTAFSGKERRIFLKGEAYFEVVRDTLHPFVIVSGPQELTVLGTSFCVRAYQDEGKIATTLESGKIHIQADNHETDLIPGQQAVLTTEGLQVQNVNTYLYTGWRKGKFVFENQSLGDIFRSLKRWYDVEVMYADPELEYAHFTGELWRYNNIREFLDKIEVLEKVRFVVKGKTITVRKY